MEQICARNFCHTQVCLTSLRFKFRLSTRFARWLTLDTRVGFRQDGVNRIQKNAAIKKILEELMNKDQVSGKIDQAVGKVQQSVGESVGNEKLANKGVVNQAKGAAKETWGDAKDAAKQIHESHKQAASEKVAENREKISQSVDDTKEKAKAKIEEFKERHSA
jgi:uncharacterized protein YjbJ (UPF0337 family)